MRIPLISRSPSQPVAPVRPDEGWSPKITPFDPKWPAKGHPLSGEAFTECLDFLETQRKLKWAGQFKCASGDIARGVLTIEEGWEWIDWSIPKKKPPVVDTSGFGVSIGRSDVPGVYGEVVFGNPFQPPGPPSLLRVPRPGEPNWPERVSKYDFSCVQWDVKEKRERERVVFNQNGMVGYAAPFDSPRAEIEAVFESRDRSCRINARGTAYFPDGAIEWFDMRVERLSR